MKNIIILAILISLQGCGAISYKPAEYTLRPGLIQELAVSGDISIVNGQPSKEQTVVYSYGGMKLVSTLNEITLTMVQQTSGEIKKNFQNSNVAGKKTIELKVNSLVSDYVAFYTKSEMNFTAKLGDGTVIEKTVKHASGSVQQDLNGCIAESVMYLLNDKQVRAYLAQKN
jgi:hypothetical protein